MQNVRQLCGRSLPALGQCGAQADVRFVLIADTKGLRERFFTRMQECEAGQS